MITLLVTMIVVSSIMLTIGFILIFSGRASKPHTLVDDTSIVKQYEYSSVGDISGADDDKSRDEAEKEFTNNSAVYIDEGGIDKELLEKQIMVAKDKNAETFLRQRAGEYLKGFTSMPFMDELISRMTDEEQQAIKETLKMKVNSEEKKGDSKPWDSDLRNL